MSSFFFVQWRKEKEKEKEIVVFLMFRSQVVGNVSLCNGLVEKHQFLRRSPTVRKDRQDLCFSLVNSSDLQLDRSSLESGLSVSLF